MNDQHDRNDLPHLATLGERLAAAGARLAVRHLPAYSWAAGLAPVLRRAADLSESWGQRFERHENGARQERVVVRSPASPATPPARWMAGPDAVPETEAGRPVEPVAPAAPAAPPAPAEQVLPVDVRTRLQSVAGPGAAIMRVRADAEADAVARGHRADAVTVGTEVRVRAGRYRPDTPEGFALLAHEASHVTALLGHGAAAHRSAPGGPAAEEEHVRQVERVARQSYGPRPAAPASFGGVGVPTASPVRTTVPTRPAAVAPNGSAEPPSPAGAAMPMRADVDRADVAAPPAFDMEALRRDLIDELMRRVRTDFERGG